MKDAIGPWLRRVGEGDSDEGRGMRTEPRQHIHPLRLFARLLRLRRGPRARHLPGMAPPPLSRETTIRRTAEGAWFHDGEPVVNAAVAEAFDRWVGVAEDGRFILENDVNWAYVDIEGPPLFVRRVHLEDELLWLSLSDRTRAPLVADTLRVSDDGVLYCTARDGVMTAGFSRKAMLDVAEWLEEDGDDIVLRVGTRRLPVRHVVSPLDPGA